MKREKPVSTMKMGTVILFAVALLACLFYFSSCNTEKGCMRKFPPQISRTDSTSNIVTLHDTAVIFQEDSSALLGWMECGKNYEVIWHELQQVKGQYMNVPTIEVKNGKVSIKAKANQHEKKIYWKERKITRTIKQTKTFPVKFIPWYVKTLAVIGGICLVATIMIVVFIALKKTVI